MKLSDPIKDFKPKAYPEGDITQFFGESPNLYKDCCGTIGHTGIDIVRAHGTPIMCVEEGKVVEIKDDPNGYGRHIRVLSKNNEWVYGHLSKISVVLGQLVGAGQVIGLMGNTGFVVSGNTPYWKYNPYAGTHLHLGRRPCRQYSGTGSWDLSYPTGDRAVLLSDYNAGFKGYTDFIAEYIAESAFKYTFNTNLQFNNPRNPLSEVEALQKALQYLKAQNGQPYMTSGVFGPFGPATKKALGQFQTERGINDPDGQGVNFGPKSRAAMNAALLAGN